MDEEYPRKADLRKDVSKPLPKIAPWTIDPASMDGDVSNTQAKTALDAFNAALASNDAEALANCFYTEQAYWRDIVALTGHLRTLAMPRVVATAMLQMAALRKIVGKLEVAGDAHFTVMSPVMCMGKMILLPVKSDGSNGAVCWKIWVLSTWVEKLVNQPEDEKLLLEPGRQLNDVDIIETQVCIVGGGSSGITFAARLKALGIESVVVDRNARADAKVSIDYRKELQSPHLLTKDEVADHLRQYATKFHLNIVSSAIIQSTIYSPSKQRWTVKFKSADGSWTKTIISKHFVQATGLGSGKPYLPPMKNEHLYKGLSIHSAKYRNAQILSEQGIKSVTVIGSANTGFDVMQDCYEAGLQTTMVARSPTYIFPYAYVMDPHGIGAYDLMPLDAADKLLSTFPSGLDGQFSHGLFAHLASQEPDRYTPLSSANFPVLTASSPSFNINHHLLERGGGHYIDVGGTDLISSGKVSVRGLVEPVAYTRSGLQLSGGSALHADAVVWCTGFADLDARATAGEVLGKGKGVDDDASRKDGELGPAEIASRLDASWGVDAEGEVRGVWKRQLRMENYWVMGGNFQQQRWWSRFVAMQIWLALDGSLMEAYRDTPVLT
ncbi:MAG: hypothetical protein Q9160_005839 [Pyrenula sp. 1 TL-2023]